MSARKKSSDQAPPAWKSMLETQCRLKEKAEADRDELLKHLKDAAKIIAYLCHRVMGVKQ